jgi:predicted Zn-dependent protease
VRKCQGIVILITIPWHLSSLAAQTASPSFASLSAQASAARDSDHLDSAAALYRQALVLNPSWTEGWWSLGTIEYDRNNYREAASALEKLCALDSKAGSGRIMLGLSEFELGKDASALAHIQEGERIGVADNQQLRNVALFHEGVLLQRAAKFEGSQSAFNSLCIAGVDTPELPVALGVAVLRLRDRTPPNQPPASEVVPRVGHAQCLAARKQFDEARREYTAVVNENPGFPNLHYAFGRFLLDAHDTAAGIAELEAEIKLRPEDPIARLQIAAAKYKIDSAGGVLYARAAVEHDPALPLGHYLLGLLLLDTGDYRRAIPELEIAQRAMSEVPNVYSALGSAYSQAGRDEDAARARATLQRLSRAAATPAAPQP